MIACGTQRDNALSRKYRMYKRHDPSANHTCTTQSRTGYLTIPKLSRSKQYGSQVKITSYNLPEDLTCIGTHIHPVIKICF